MKKVRCPRCKALVGEVTGELYPLLLDLEPAPWGDVVLEQSQTGATRGRELREDEKVKPGTSLYVRHSQSCRGAKQKPAPPIERREPCA